MTQKDTNVFAGHRDRMRAKLRNFGVRYFESYELLEMLLYFAIPRRNTHPTAKLLLKEFSTLEGVFSASADELSKISGVGNECAEFIKSVSSFINYSEPSDCNTSKRRFSDYKDIGEFFLEYFHGKRENEIAILLLDSDFGYIDCKKVYSLDLASGAVQAKPFIDAAIRANASVSAIAHNHPFAPPFPTDGDWESDKMLKASLQEAGIMLFESYVVTDEGCKPFSKPLITLTANDDTSNNERENTDSDFSLKLMPVLGRATKSPELLLVELKKNFSSRSELFETDIFRLQAITKNERIAELLVIIAALASRRRTEGFRFGKNHTEEEIKDFLISFYMNFSTESAVILPIDENGKILAVEVLTDGTVNALNIIPRMILEKLAARRAQSFILAHNHPGGVATPSHDDLVASANLAASLEKCGVLLKDHYVIAKNECNKINFRE